MAQIKLGELLLKANVLQEGQLKAALTEQQKWGGKLGEILVRMHLLTEDLLVKALSKQLGLATVNIDAIQGLPPQVKAKVSAKLASDFEIVPLQLRDEGKTLVVATSDPLNVQALDELRAMTKLRIVPQIAGRSAIQKAFARFYEGEGDMSDFEGSFKVVDAFGRTVVRNLSEVDPEAAPAKPGPPVSGAPRGRPTPHESPAARAAPAPAKGSATELLKSVEEVQRKEVSALKAMVELLIEKGVFTREEYLAKVKR